MPSNLPTGTVTFLFTDIEGSTRMAQQHRKSWEGMRDRHHEILRAALEAHNGYLFEIVGDAFCVAFHQPEDALLTALDAQRGLQAEPWAEAPIRVRMGIHTGVAEPDGERYRGYMALSSVARVMSVAHGGQVVLSQSSHEILEGSLPEEVTLRDLGEHRLKDLLRPQHLFQPIAADLPSEFPPLKTLDVTPHNLPVQLTSFIGRDQELGKLAALLTKERLVSLTGTAGTGKTRLAMQVAAEVLDRFPDGAWLVELAPLSDPALVPQAIASALKIQEHAGREPVDALKDSLGGRSLLLILDNCEHLIEASAQIADALLRAAPKLHILATSREPLGIAGEATFRVETLGLPDPASASADAIAGSEAVRLFVDRAAAAQPGFQMTDKNAGAIARITAELDGIPLAIELAAARARGMTVEQIASRLDDRLRLLTGGSRAAQPRQRTLQATIDWSHDLLSEQERAVFRRLSVFVGGWTLEAALQVASGSDVSSRDVEELLPALVEKSLILLDSASGRYHMLETVRAYALGRLEAAGEGDATRTRHVDYWTEVAQRPEIDEWMDEGSLGVLEPDHQNLLEALRWCEVTEDGAAKALEILGGTRLYWWLAGEYQATYDLARRALERPGAQARNRSRQRALHGLAHAGIFSGRAGEVINAVQESLSIARELSDKRAIIETLHVIGMAELNLGNTEAGIPHIEEGLAMIGGAGMNVLKGMMLNSLGEAMRMSGDLDRAQAAYEEAVTLRDLASGTGMFVITHLNLGSVAVARGDLSKARESLLEGMRRLHVMDFSVTFAGAFLDTCSGLMAAAGRWEQAARMWGAADSVRDSVAYVREPADLQLLEPLLARARDALGEDAYQAAYAGGQLLTMAQALEETRRLLEAFPGES